MTDDFSWEAIRRSGCERGPSSHPTTHPDLSVQVAKVHQVDGAELHAAPLSGKRLLALWNALPGVEKRRKVGDCPIDRHYAGPDKRNTLSHRATLSWASWRVLRPGGDAGVALNYGRIASEL